MTILHPTGRGFLLGMLAAPVIVRASTLMPVKSVPMAFVFPVIATCEIPPPRPRHGDIWVSYFDSIMGIGFVRAKVYDGKEWRDFSTVST